MNECAPLLLAEEPYDRPLADEIGLFQAAAAAHADDAVTNHPGMRDTLNAAVGASF